MLLVHRAYGDWTFPKGKCDPGESDEACALREVEEETGLRCALEDELPSTAYVDGRGRRRSCATGGSASSAARSRSSTRSTRHAG